MIKIRPASSDDLPFVLDSWWRSWSALGVNKPSMSLLRIAIEALMQNYPTLIAHNPSDPWQIFGWVCGDRRGDLIHLAYLFVKQPYRRLGIGTALLRALDAQGSMHVESLLHSRAKPWLAFAAKHKVAYNRDRVAQEVVDADRVSGNIL